MLEFYQPDLSLLLQKCIYILQHLARPLVSCICVYPVVVELFSRIIAISSAGRPEIGTHYTGKNQVTALRLSPFTYLMFVIFFTQAKFL